MSHQNEPSSESPSTPSPLDLLTQKMKSGQLKRRDFLAKAMAIGVSASAAAAIAGPSAQAQQLGAPTTLRVGEEGQPQFQNQNGNHGQPPQVTTYAVGEEGTHHQHEHGGHATTLRVGEEGQTTTSHHGEEGQTTTFAVGEEGTTTTQHHGEEGTATTFAVGEEGPAPSTRAYGEEGVTPPPTPTPTTQAIGEEGGREQICPHTGRPIQSAPSTQQWNSFRRW